MIWVIAGTKNARELINILLQKGFHIIATTTTEYGSAFLGIHDNLKLFSKALCLEDMIILLDNENVKLTIDASHPYAAEVSINAINACSQKHVPYVRYEREQIRFQGVKEFSDYRGIAEYLKIKDGNILLSIGSKNLHYFSGLKNRIFARVLPVKKSIALCEESGIKPDRIICMMSSFSKDLHKLLYNELKIEYLVTKESGEEGGVLEKVGAALECGVEVLMLKRPEIQYPEVKYYIDEIIGLAAKIIM